MNLRKVFEVFGVLRLESGVPGCGVAVPVPGLVVVCVLDKLKVHLDQLVAIGLPQLVAAVQHHFGNVGKFPKEVHGFFTSWILAGFFYFLNSCRLFILSEFLQAFFYFMNSCRLFLLSEFLQVFFTSWILAGFFYFLNSCRLFLLPEFLQAFLLPEFLQVFFTSWILAGFFYFLNSCRLFLLPEFLQAFLLPEFLQDCFTSWILAGFFTSWILSGFFLLPEFLQAFFTSWILAGFLLWIRTDRLVTKQVYSFLNCWQISTSRRCAGLLGKGEGFLYYFLNSCRLSTYEYVQVVYWLNKSTASQASWRQAFFYWTRAGFILLLCTVQLYILKLLEIL